VPVLEDTLLRLGLMFAPETRQFITGISQLRSSVSSELDGPLDCRLSS
jgi:hypothetical protein